MANTSFSGKNGIVNFNNGAVANIKSWTVTIDVDMLDSSIMDADDWKSFLASMKGFTGSIEANLETTGLNIPISDLGKEEESVGVPSTVELLFGQTFLEGALVGPAIISNIGATSNFDISTFTANLTGNGEIEFRTTDPNP